tara:strand:+ start:9931 stop:10038 length:108 start_codon:yes stop_codon:yes gene_type:complete
MIEIIAIVLSTITLIAMVGKNDDDDYDNFYPDTDI